MNKKYSILLVLILLVMGGFLVFKSFQSSPTDQIACTMEAKVCPDGSYVGRTGPKCEFSACPNAFTYTNATSDSIQVELPYPDAVVGKEFSVLGKARGTWFFEASFPVVLLDKDGQILAQGIAQANGEWMTTEFVPFKADLKVMNQNYIGKGTLILKKDNPSGDAVRDASVSFEINIEY
ncbi:MAG: Gmad2 immunoglobulin-like domain-containing protein [Minisyncoccota bacterium]